MCGSHAHLSNDCIRPGRKKHFAADWEAERKEVEKRKKEGGGKKSMAKGGKKGNGGNKKKRGKTGGGGGGEQKPPTGPPAKSTTAPAKEPRTPDEAEKTEKGAYGGTYGADDRIQPSQRELLKQANLAEQERIKKAAEERRGDRQKKHKDKEEAAQRSQRSTSGKT